MKGYKAFDKNLKCRDMQFRVGESFSVSGEIIPCKNGIHFCEKLKDVYEYYPKTYDTRICEVEVREGAVLITDGDKSVTSNLKILRELSEEEIKNLTDDLKFNSGYYNLLR